MNVRPVYKTKQKESLVKYLETVQGKHITAADVCEYFREQGNPMGQSTVYRQLERLVDEGVVNKYIVENSPACFEYVGTQSHCSDDVCFHCKCEKCGILIHLHCDELKELQAHLFAEHKFRMNPLRTVFYGICDACMRAAEA